MSALFRSTRTRTYASFFCVVVVVSCFAIRQFRNPQYNWDMLAYMAVALIDTGRTIAAAHHEVYEVTKLTIPPKSYQELVDSNDLYRIATATVSAIFSESLPFYTVKPIYPALVAVLYLCGINLVKATITIAVVGYFLSCMIIYIWISRWLAARIAVPLTIMLALIPQLITVANLSTPDSLSLFVLLLGIYLVIERGRSALGLAILLLAIAVRPENIIYYGALAIYCFILNKNSKIVLAIMSMIAISLDFSLTKLSGYYGWETLFYFSNVDRVISMVGFVSPLHISNYFLIYFNMLKYTLFNPGDGLAVFVTVGFGAAAMKLRSGKYMDPYLHLIYLACILAVARTLILPGDAHRALLPCYMLVTIALVHACVYPGLIYEREAKA